MNTKHKETRTEISSIGEFGLINTIKTQFDTFFNSTSILGIGDDAAIISPKENEQVLLAADMMVEGIHFDLAYTPLKHLGYKVAVINFR
jgi:thiamine-monophosphate kinase